jgi:hypothetical protein
MVFQEGELVVTKVSDGRTGHPFPGWRDFFLTFSVWTSIVIIIA